MIFVLIILVVMFSADAWWWYYAHRQAVRTGMGRGWRVALGIFMSVMIVGIGLFILARAIHSDRHFVPELLNFTVYLWHLMILPFLLVWSLGHVIIAKLLSAWRAIFTQRPDAVEQSNDAYSTTVDDHDTAENNRPDDVELPSRRRFLGYAATVVPPAVAIGLTGEVLVNSDDFRVRTINLRLPDLPKQLDGMSIGFVSDPHIGSFMSDKKLKNIIETTNNLDTDLVLQGGDLINNSLGDLPDGIDMLRKLRGRYGVWSCEGNHDCIDDQEEFERQTLAAGVNMLLDTAPVITLRGQPVQLIVPRWVGRPDAAVHYSVRQVLPLYRRDVFAIGLAHHPHAFDIFAEAGVPLTLAGHSHGGQMALTDGIGIGPMMYRYWSGEYHLGRSAAVISNGVGNWFPLRINVPCEVIKLVLYK